MLIKTWQTYFTWQSVTLNIERELFEKNFFIYLNIWAQFLIYFEEIYSRYNNISQPCSKLT